MRPFYFLLTQLLAPVAEDNVYIYLLRSEISVKSYAKYRQLELELGEGATQVPGMILPDGVFFDSAGPGSGFQLY